MHRSLAVGLAVTVGLLLVVPTALAFEAVSPNGENWKKWFMQVFWVALIVGVVVWGLLIYALIRFRARKGGPQEGPHIHGNTRMEIAWTIAPALVMGWLLVISYNGLFITDTPAEDEYDFNIRVTASRFSWQFEYPDGELSTNGTLRVEANQTVKVILRSTDVIHAFGVTELAVMLDVRPDKDSVTWFKATVPGTYALRCRELCGVGHSRMLGSIIIFPEGSEGDRHWGWAAPPVPTPTNTTSPTTTPPTNTTTNQTAQGTPVTLFLAPGLTITPAESTANVGDTLVVTADNTDGIVHNLYIGVFDANQPDHGALWKTEDLQGGEKATIQVGAFDKDVTYEYWCDKPGHRQGLRQGMSGVLVVGKGSALEEKEPLLPGPSPVVALVGVAVLVFVLRRRTE